MQCLKNFIGCIMVVVSACSVHAMEESFVHRYDREFHNFTKIDGRLIERAIDRVCDQDQPWSCGKHQCGHLFEIVHDGRKECVLTYSDLCDYPLSLGINMNERKISSLMEHLPKLTERYETDHAGNFRIGPTPSQIAAFINQHVMGDTSTRAVHAWSKSTLSRKTFVGIVKDNLTHALPVLVYYVISNDDSKMHIYSIVGISHSEEELLVLNTTGKGFARLHRMNLDEFLAALDASKIVERVKSIDFIGKFIDLRGAIASVNATLAPTSDIDAWHAFSLITFVPTHDENESESFSASENDSLFELEDLNFNISFEEETKSDDASEALKQVESIFKFNFNLGL